VRSTRTWPSSGPFGLVLCARTGGPFWQCLQQRLSRAYVGSCFWHCCVCHNLMQAGLSAPSLCCLQGLCLASCPSICLIVPALKPFKGHWQCLQHRHRQLSMFREPSLALLQRAQCHDSMSQAQLEVSTFPVCCSFFHLPPHV
jgi:hypothetical protein